MKRAADRHRRPAELSVGQRVRLSTNDIEHLLPGAINKLKKRWIGPYKVTLAGDKTAKNWSCRRSLPASIAPSMRPALSRIMTEKTRLKIHLQPRTI